MTFSIHRLAVALLALGCAGLTGCLPSGQSAVDEEKETHFLAGKSRVTEMDYPGAIDAFEKALEVNPRSGAAHFELALLIEKQGNDPAAAIYHYEQYLKFRPNAENADVLVKPHIQACKQELARTVSLGAVTERQQHYFEQLAEENRLLKEQVQQWQARYATNPPAPAAPPAAPVRERVVASSPAAPVKTLEGSAGRPSPSPAGRTSLPSSSSTRTHTIKAGETPTIIARKYGVKVDALMAANPRLDARRLQVGQPLAIPGAQ